MTFQSTMYPVGPWSGSWVSESPRPTLNFDLTAGVLPPGAVYSRNSHATRVGPDGRLRWAPHNYVVNTPLVGAALGVLGSGGSLPTGWSWNASAGLTREVVGLGNLSDGTPYIDVRLSGTNASASTVYPHVILQPALNTYAGELRPGMRVAVSALLQRLAGSTAGFAVNGAGFPGADILSSSNAYISGATITALSPKTHADTTLDLLARRSNPAPDQSDRVVPYIGFIVQGSATVDITIRIAAPMAERVGDQDADVRTTFVPNASTTGLVFAPRFDYDPVTLEPLGLLMENVRTNRIPNSEGIGFVAGTPGTAPADWAMSTSGSGITRQIVAVGTLPGPGGGMNYVDVRFSGTTTGVYSAIMDPVQSTAVAAAVGDTWTGSVWLGLLAGSLPNSGGATALIDLIERDASANFLVSTGTFLTGITSQPTRFAVTRTMSNASIAAVQLAIRVNGIPSGTVVDFTLRIARPQLELGRGASSYIPTFGAIASRAADTCQLNAAGWVAPDRGTFLAQYRTPKVYDLTGSAHTVFDIAASSTNRIQLRVEAGGVRPLTLAAGNTSWDPFAPIPPQDAVVRSGFTYRAGSGEVASQGTLLADSAVTVPDLSTAVLHLGRASWGSESLAGHIQRLTYFPVDLPVHRLRALTA